VIIWMSFQAGSCGSSASAGLAGGDACTSGLLSCTPRSPHSAEMELAIASGTGPQEHPQRFSLVTWEERVMLAGIAPRASSRRARGRAADQMRIGPSGEVPGPLTPQYDGQGRGR
jgi:hypothetical protein